MGMKPELDLDVIRPDSPTSRQTSDELAGPSGSRPTNWLLVVAACAGIGVGAGASFAVGSQPSVGSGHQKPGEGGKTPTSATDGTAETSAHSGKAPDAMRPAPVNAVTAAVPAAAADGSGSAAPRSAEALNDEDLATDDDKPPVLPEEDAPPVHDQAQVDALVAELAATHKRLHASDAASAVDKATEAALDTVFAKQKIARKFAREFYAAFGVGRFVSAGSLTPLGQGVVAMVGELERHAIDPASYQREALAAVVANLGRDENGATLSGSVSILRGLLAAPTFDAAEARERVSSMRELPTPSAVGAIAASLAGGTGPTAADTLPDAHVFKAFLELALDFRFIKKAGPTSIRTREAVFDRDRKALKDFMADIVSRPGGEGVKLLIPPHPQYTSMLGFYATYRELAAKGGCEKVATGWRFRAGSKGAEVKKLQARLACQGFYDGELDGKFEGATVEAVKSFQRHHDIPDEGNVLEETINSLNVSIDYRVKQMALALQRMREGRFERMGDFFIRVNIPSFLLKVFENGQLIREHRVIVGTNRLDDDKVNLVQGHINRTKLLATRLYEVIVNPTWILPKRVEEGELKSSLEKDSDYLAKSNIKKVKLGSGTEVFVQGSGSGNVLGKVKFLLEESNAIYLHDTDKRQLFKKQRRDFSHGCMRVHEAIEFGKWLLAHDGWPTDEVEKAFGARSLQRGFKLKKPIHTVTEYITVDVSAEGKPVFFTDIYGYDSAYFNDKLPAFEKTRWGSDRLRPRWVPLVESKQVDEWRAKGKPAPRNLGADGKPKPEPKGKPATEAGGSEVDGP
jgi:hypothetical protein